MKNFGAYIVLVHMYQPIPRTDKVQVSESVEFVDRLRNRHMDNATAIIDLISKKIIKSRPETTYDEYVAYFEEKYPKEMQKLYSILDMGKVLVTPTVGTEQEIIETNE